MLILRNKRQIKLDDNSTYLDLIGVVFKPADGTKLKDFHIVTEETEGRIDKISMLAYGSLLYSSILLKFNGISNPYSIMVGDVILIPDSKFTENSLVKISEVKKIAEAIKKRVQTNNEKSPQIDEKRIERLKKLASKFPNPSTEFNQPNRLEAGETNVDRRDGLLFFK